MTNKPIINEFIVVEGHSDTINLARAVIADTIETGGSAIKPDAILRAQKAAQSRGVIILTDPDFNGQRIRRIITAAVPTAKQAYITQNQGRASKDNPHKSLGVEHASPETLRAILSHVMTPKITEITDVDRAFLQKSGLLSGPDARQLRERVGEVLNIGYTNGKQLLKSAQQFGITKEQFLVALKRK